MSPVRFNYQIELFSLFIVKVVRVFWYLGEQKHRNNDYSQCHMQSTMYNDYFASARSAFKHRIHLVSTKVFFLAEGFFLFRLIRSSWTMMFEYIAIWSNKVISTSTLENSWIFFFLLYCYHELVMIRVALAECSSEDRLIVTLSISI